MTVLYDVSSGFISSIAFIWFFFSKSATKFDFSLQISIISLILLPSFSMFSHISSRLISSLRSFALSGSVKNILRRALRSGFILAIPSIDDSNALNPPNLTSFCSSLEKSDGRSACFCTEMPSCCCLFSLIVIPYFLH